MSWAAEGVVQTGLAVVQRTTGRTGISRAHWLYKGSMRLGCTSHTRHCLLTHTNRTRTNTKHYRLRGAAPLIDTPGGGGCGGRATMPGGGVRSTRALLSAPSPRPRAATGTAPAPDMRPGGGGGGLRLKLRWPLTPVAAPGSPRTLNGASHVPLPLAATPLALALRHLPGGSWPLCSSPRAAAGEAERCATGLDRARGAGSALREPPAVFARDGRFCVAALRGRCAGASTPPFSAASARAAAGGSTAGSERRARNGSARGEVAAGAAAPGSAAAGGWPAPLTSGAEKGRCARKSAAWAAAWRSSVRHGCEVQSVLAWPSTQSERRARVSATFMRRTSLRKPTALPARARASAPASHHVYTREAH